MKKNKKINEEKLKNESEKSFPIKNIKIKDNVVSLSGKINKQSISSASNVPETYVEPLIKEINNTPLLNTSNELIEEKQSELACSENVVSGKTTELDETSEKVREYVKPYHDSLNIFNPAFDQNNFDSFGNRYCFNEFDEVVHIIYNDQNESFPTGTKNISNFVKDQHRQSENVVKMVSEQTDETTKQNLIIEEVNKPESIIQTTATQVGIEEGSSEQSKEEDIDKIYIKTFIQMINDRNNARIMEFERIKQMHLKRWKKEEDKINGIENEEQSSDESSSSKSNESSSNESSEE